MNLKLFIPNREKHNPQIFSNILIAEGFSGLDLFMTSARDVDLLILALFTWLNIILFYIKTKNTVQNENDILSILYVFDVVIKKIVLTIAWTLIIK